MLLVHRTVAWSVLAASLFLSPALRAETIDVSVEGSLSDRLVSLEIHEVNGERYVPLRSLVEQAGGAFAVLPTRARVDLFGETAWVKADDALVHALSPFSLSRPVLQRGEHFLVAVADLTDFFQRAFRKRAQVIGGGTVAPSTASAMTSVVPPPPTGAVPAPRDVVPRPEPEPGTLEGLAPATPKAPTQYRTLVIDPGHGGYDAGAQSGDNVSEDEVVLAIAMQVKGRLAAGGPIQSLLTRESDVDVSRGRTSAIMSVKPDFVVSIHVGTSLSPAARGVATFYAPPISFSTGALSGGRFTTTTIGADIAAESHRLARAVGTSLAEATGVPLRGVVEAPLRGLGDLSVPSIVVEVGCLSNEQAAQALLDPVYQGRIADGIVRGIQAFVSREDPSTTETAEVLPEL